MLVAFFESLKYVGHQYPIAVLRIYLGYYFVDIASSRMSGEFLTQPRMAAVIMENLPSADIPAWYLNLMQDIVVPNWQFFAYVIVYCEFIIGISMLLGFLVRPAAILGCLLMVNFIAVGNSGGVDLQKVLFAVFFVFFWLGAGRCLGLDYFFYKRQRGLWW